MSGITAVILAGGNGKRMKMDVPKQYLPVHGHPLIYYTIRAFENSSVDEIVLVTGKNDVLYCKEEIVLKYGFKKVVSVTEGGAERYDSVYCGLKAAGVCDYILIHDGARACIGTDVIENAIENVKRYGAAVAAVPVKDTIKQASEDGFVTGTPDRRTLWQIQTPQAFAYEGIKKAYDSMYAAAEFDGITDDSMVMERYGETPIKLFEADYNNIKVTTPEDIALVVRLLEEPEKMLVFEGFNKK